MKLYTPEEADRLLPFLAPALVELRDRFNAAAEMRAKLAAQAAANGGGPTKTDLARALERVGELMERIHAWAIELRDIETGLVDFPAIVQGEEAFLCWRLGEERVGHWHSTTTGFADRRPL
jgi:hypothetical protein